MNTNRKQGLVVYVDAQTDSGIQKAMRKFKRKVNDDNRLREYRERQEFVKPSAKRKRAKAAAKKRWEREVDKTKQQPRQY